MADHEVPEEVRRRLCLVLDVDDLVAARRTADLLAPWVGTVLSRRAGGRGDVRGIRLRCVL